MSEIQREITDILLQSEIQIAHKELLHKDTNFTALDIYAAVKSQLHSDRNIEAFKFLASIDQQLQHMVVTYAQREGVQTYSSFIEEAFIIDSIPSPMEQEILGILLSESPQTMVAAQQELVRPHLLFFDTDQRVGGIITSSTGRVVVKTYESEGEKEIAKIAGDLDIGPRVIETCNYGLTEEYLTSTRFPPLVPPRELGMLYGQSLSRLHANGIVYGEHLLRHTMIQEVDGKTILKLCDFGNSALHSNPNSVNFSPDKEEVCWVFRQLYSCLEDQKNAWSSFKWKYESEM